MQNTCIGPFELWVEGRMMIRPVLTIRPIHEINNLQEIARFPQMSLSIGSCIGRLSSLDTRRSSCRLPFRRFRKELRRGWGDEAICTNNDRGHSHDSNLYVEIAVIGQVKLSAYSQAKSEYTLPPSFKPAYRSVDCHPLQLISVHRRAPMEGLTAELAVVSRLASNVLVGVSVRQGRERASMRSSHWPE